MIDTDRLELIDTGDGTPLTKCEQNLYEVLACQEDGSFYDPQRIYDAFEDMNGLVAEVLRLRTIIQGGRRMIQTKCQGKDCKRMAEKVEDDYYACYSCGWAGCEEE